MKKILLLPFLLLSLFVKSQLLSWTPDFIKEASDPAVITMDANYGNKGLLNYSPASDVYVHIGVITNKSTAPNDWKHVKFSNFNAPDPSVQCTFLGDNKWKYTINGGLRSFFNVTDATETIQKIAILFRNGNGSKKQANADGSDMYIPVYDNGVYARIDVPYNQPTYMPMPEPITKNVGDALTITAKANTTGTLKIYFNGSLLNSTSAQSLTVNTTIAVSGDQQIIAESTNGSTHRDTLKFVVAPANNVADLPDGATDGINYEAGNTSVVLVLYAPGKKNVFVLGDFNSWTASSNSLMNITPDGKRYWIRVSGLTPGTEYAYQYLIDGSLKVADPYTEKVLDPDNDQYIPAATYPDLKAYPNGKTTGIVSVLQTAKPSYSWQVTSFTKPNKNNLLIYELLVRDFVATHNWQTLKDTLSYLKRLGINAIEVMPFNEFEGNSSWGYNPSFYFAPDKYYGTETALKQFIDECHKQGIAVIMDMVLNHSFGQSPMVQMYWDAANSRPAANSPWFNTVPKHAYNVGYDINHESIATNDFVNRVISHWLINYKIDGFRWDLSKGFTQKQTCDANGENCNESTFAVYDAGRIAIWKKYYGYMQTAAPGSYCILEHFADNTEEKELADNGMMLWGNGNYNYNEATMGWLSNSNFEGIIYSKRGWTQPNLVGYMESHDEERLMFKNEKYGNNNNASYKVRDTAIGLKRNGMAAAFWAMIPGPKMIWEFGELGYDYSRCYLSTNGEEGDCNKKLDPKPIRWDYYNNANRKALYDVYMHLLKLRTTPAYLSTFTTGITNSSLGGAIKWLNVSDNALKVVVYGNFDVVAQTANVTFPSTGTWYSYLNDSVATVNSTTVTVTLPPGAYYVFTSKDIVLPVNLLSFTAEKTGKQMVKLKWSTTAETNNQYFEVQRSGDGNNFTTIGKVNGTASSSAVKQYQFMDAKAGNINYYRLKQIDKDGQVHYSAIIRVSFDEVIRWQLYPNPANANTALHVQENVTDLRITLTDATGKMIYKRNIEAAVAGQRVALPINNLAKGLYFIKIQSDTGSSTEKMIVQ